MIITFSPQRRDQPVALERLGDALIIDGATCDFSPLPAGYSLPAEAIPCDLFVEPVRRDEAGVLHITMVLPHGPAAPEEARFPASIIDPPDGPIAMPPFGRGAD